MYSKILVPLDGSELAECVFPHVESIVKGCGVQNVIFLRVVEPFVMPSGYYGYGFTSVDIQRINAEAISAAETYLKEVVSRTKYNGVNVRQEVITGKTAESITEYAAKNSIDLIAIATHGRGGISRWAWGSVADRVLHSTCVPILMIRAPGCVPQI